MLHPQVIVSEPISVHARSSTYLTADQHFRRQLEAAVRDALCWYPKVATHASVGGLQPETGATWTAHGRRLELDGLQEINLIHLPA